MKFEDIALGIDIEDISRFKGKTPEKDKDFLTRIYTDDELEYSFKSSKPEGRLCARFCAKEAVVKALSEFNISDVYYSDIEISNKEDGSPQISVEKYPNIKFKVSLSHCKTYATASVIAYRTGN